MLSKCLVFIKLNHPLSVTDLQKSLFDYYKSDLDRVVVFRNCEKLAKWGLIVKVNAGDLLAMPEDEKNQMHKLAEAKHRKFLQTISPQFRVTYNNRNYVWVSNGEGEKYLEWACKINGFKFNKK